MDDIRVTNPVKRNNEIMQEIAQNRADHALVADCNLEPAFLPYNGVNATTARRENHSVAMTTVHWLAVGGMAS